MYRFLSPSKGFYVCVWKDNSEVLRRCEMQLRKALGWCRMGGRTVGKGRKGEWNEKRSWTRNRRVNSKERREMMTKWREMKGRNG